MEVCARVSDILSLPGGARVEAVTAPVLKIKSVYCSHRQLSLFLHNGPEIVRRESFFSPADSERLAALLNERHNLWRADTF